MAISRCLAISSSESYSSSSTFLVSAGVDFVVPVAELLDAAGLSLEVLDVLYSA
jgi:hypothetical protein